MSDPAVERARQKRTPIVVEVCDLTPAIAELVFTYMYSGRIQANEAPEVPSPQHDVPDLEIRTCIDLLNAAFRYQVRGLRSCVESYLVDTPGYVCETLFCQLLLISRRYKCPGLLHALLEFLLQSPEIILKAKQWDLFKMQHESFAIAILECVALTLARNSSDRKIDPDDAAEVLHYGGQSNNTSFDSDGLDEPQVHTQQSEETAGHFRKSPDYATIETIRQSRGRRKEQFVEVTTRPAFKSQQTSELSTTPSSPEPASPAHSQSSNTSGTSVVTAIYQRPMKLVDFKDIDIAHDQSDGGFRSQRPGSNSPQKSADSHAFYNPNFDANGDVGIPMKTFGNILKVQKENILTDAAVPRFGLYDEDEREEETNSMTLLLNSDGTSRLVGKAWRKQQI